MSEPEKLIVVTMSIKERIPGEGYPNSRTLAEFELPVDNRDPWPIFQQALTALTTISLPPHRMLT